MVLSQQTPPLIISAPLTDDEMLEQQTLEEAKNSAGALSSADEKNIDDESKRYIV